MLSKAIRIWALLCLVLALQLATAQSFQVIRRDDSSTATSTIPPTSSRPTATGKPTGDGGNANDSKSNAPTMTNGPDSTRSAASSTSASIATTTGVFDNSTYFNATIPAGQLPIQPVITPGWGVAGVIMLLSGLVYTLIGIKNRLIHSFFSTAYIASLGVTVLIIYVMSLPISDGVQGGYVVAIIMAGCALGAASTFFKELTEGLGCALGGFCISMWLLCLVDGGLLQSTVGKVILIACFTLAAFCFYFSRFTRDWAMIIFMSFAGSTVVILGLDCFSRAGLKEFWAYIWNLNDNLFPLGATTYPVTKGIRVETAAIIIICLVGIISQIKLWRIVREKREKRAAERVADQRDLDEEEENVGRQVQQTTERDRAEWERVYGDGTLTNVTVSGSSDPSDENSEKRMTRSQAGSTYAHSKTEGIEMADMSDTSQSRAEGLMAAEGAQEGKVMIRVAVDDVADGPLEGSEEVVDEKLAVASDTNSKMVESAPGVSSIAEDSRRTSRQRSDAGSPEIVPLPFRVPVEDTTSIGDRSSIATFADEEDITPSARPRHSLVKRLSHNSVTLLRSLSQRSRNAPTERQLESGESSEELVEPAPYAHEDDRSSLAVTVDNESVSGGDRDSIITTDKRRSIEITAELGKTGEGELELPGNAEEKLKMNHNEVLTDLKEKGKQKLTEVSKQADEEADKDAVKGSDKTTHTPTTENSKVSMNEPGAAVNGDVIEDTELESAEKAKSVAKSIVSSTSTPANLTKDRLPRSLSKVALSYRTNEWAKHLSNAEAPDLDELVIQPVAPVTKRRKEIARSVDVEDLKKGAQDGTLPPAIKRSDSQTSQISTTPRSSKVISKKEATTSLITASTSQELNVAPRSPISPGVGSTSARPTSVGIRLSSSGFAPIVEEHDGQAVVQAVTGETTEQDIAPISQTQNQSESTRPAVPGVVSFSSPQTLLGQRETWLRNRSQGNLLSPMPEAFPEPSKPASDAGSLYNYPAYAAAFSSDPDDMPLNQRKEMMRSGSMMSLTASNYGGLNHSNSGIEASENTAFNSHQPKRISSVPTAAARQARLANFRQSVAQDLRSATPGLPSTGRETPFGSTSNLVSGFEQQRSMLMEQKEAETQRREMQRREKEWHDRMFDSRMRSGDLLDAHREVLRKMQSSARDS